MKVKELISLLEKLPQDDKVMTKERYTDDMTNVTIVRKEYKNLNETYCYIQ